MPEEFFDAAEFSDRIAPNQHLNQAIRALRSPPDVEAALAELERITACRRAISSSGIRSTRSVCAPGERQRRYLESEQRFRSQQKINDLNTIGHVFTRTRKREVQDHFPARRARDQGDACAAERAFYDAVTDSFGPGRACRNFAVIMPQRQVASSIPAAREYLRERWDVDLTIEDDTVAELEFDVEGG